MLSRIELDPGFKDQRKAADTALVVLASAALHTYLDFEYILQEHLSLGDVVRA